MRALGWFKPVSLITVAGIAALILENITTIQLYHNCVSILAKHMTEILNFNSEESRIVSRCCNLGNRSIMQKVP